MNKTESGKKTWLWTGITRSGDHRHGMLEANSMAIAKASLQQQGILVKKIVKKRHFHFFTNNRIRAADIALFARQLATMTEAGIPLLQTFDNMMKDQKISVCGL